MDLEFLHNRSGSYASSTRSDEDDDYGRDVHGKLATKSSSACFSVSMLLLKDRYETHGNGCRAALSRFLSHRSRLGSSDLRLAQN